MRKEKNYTPEKSIVDTTKECEEMGLLTKRRREQNRGHPEVAVR